MLIGEQDLALALQTQSFDLLVPCNEYYTAIESVLTYISVILPCPFTLLLITFLLICFPLDI